MRTIKRRPRMTVRKRMQKVRRTTNRINRKLKTRRRRCQSGGRFSSFIDANDNTDSQGKKGIDVKVELDKKTGQPLQWLIGGDGFMDATFKQLQDGAKEGRYRKFIEQLLATRKDFRFSNEGSSRDSSKGIKLTHAVFCQMFINNPIPQLTYPTLITRFRDRGYNCSQSSASSASSASPFKSLQSPSQPHPNQTNAAVEQLKSMGFEDDTAIRRALLKTNNNVVEAIELLSASTHPQSPSQPHPNQTNAAVEQLKSMGFEDDAAIRRALLKTNNNVDDAIGLLLSQPSIRPAARGGIVSAAPISAAPPSAVSAAPISAVSAAPISSVSAAPISAVSAALPSKSPFKTPPCDEYFQFEKWLRDDQFVQPYKILEHKYGIYANDANMLDISLGWANASYECNGYYIDSFIQYADQNKIKTQGNYEKLVMGSFEMEIPAKINIGPGLIQKVQDNGWCFYSAVLTAAHKPNYVRTFAEAITYCVLNNLTNTKDAIKHRVRTLVNGILSDITVEQLVKLISIPNLSEKNGPCVYPELEQCIGQTAAYLLNKNIIIYDESGNLLGKYRGIDSTNPDDQIHLVNKDGKHFDIITTHS